MGRIMIKVGEKLPSGFFRIKDSDGNAGKVTTDELFAGQKVVLVGVPGAFTATCHMAHIPRFVDNAEALKAKGVDRIAVMARGRLRQIRPTGDWTEESIMACAVASEA